MNKVVDTQELLPCPFCGEPGMFEDSAMGHSVVCCSQCGAAGSTAPDDDAAKLRWNTRTTQPFGDAQELATIREIVHRLKGDPDVLAEEIWEHFTALRTTQCSGDTQALAEDFRADWQRSDAIETAARDAFDRLGEVLDNERLTNSARSAIQRSKDDIHSAVALEAPHAHSRILAALSRPSKTVEIAQLLEALGLAQRHYRLALNALGRSYRVQPGTKTAAKHRADYERHTDIAEEAIRAATAKAKGGAQ